MKKIFFIITAICFFGPSLVFAHPGRTDSSGCHTCRTNCANWGLSTGEYHCHNSKGVAQPSVPIRSHYGAGGTGTTEVWPAYDGVSSTVTSSAVSKTTISSNLMRGSQGADVTRLQTILSKYPDIYPEASITGYFGPSTERAVIQFQKKYNLEQVGSVGPKTRELLNSLK